MEHEQFERLAMPLFDQLYNFAHWLSQNRADAEDLVQETYAKALKGFGSFAEGTNFRAWMYRILRNCFLSSKAGLAAMATSPLDEDEPEMEARLAHGMTPEVLAIRREGYSRMLRALEELPVVYREIVLLCEVEELSYREIAQVLAVPVGTVMSRLARARQRLRGMLMDTAMREASRDAV